MVKLFGDCGVGEGTWYKVWEGGGHGIKKLCSFTCHHQVHTTKDTPRVIHKLGCHVGIVNQCFNND